MLSTCNRTELYLASDDPSDHLDERASGALLALAGDDGAALAPVLYRLGDDSAALHLFRVAAGLDSLVPGEGEILGQVRDAFEGGLDRAAARPALPAGPPRGPAGAGSRPRSARARPRCRPPRPPSPSRSSATSTAAGSSSSVPAR